MSLKICRWHEKKKDYRTVLYTTSGIQANLCLFCRKRDDRLWLFSFSRRKYDEISEPRGSSFTCHTWLFSVYLIWNSLLWEIIEGKYLVGSKEGLGFYVKMNHIHSKSDYWVYSYYLQVLPMFSCFRGQTNHPPGLERDYLHARQLSILQWAHCCLFFCLISLKTPGIGVLLNWGEGRVFNSGTSDLISHDSH